MKDMLVAAPHSAAHFLDDPSADTHATVTIFSSVLWPALHAEAELLSEDSFFPTYQTRLVKSVLRKLLTVQPTSLVSLHAVNLHLTSLKLQEKTALPSQNVLN